MTEHQAIEWDAAQPIQEPVVFTGPELPCTTDATLLQDALDALDTAKDALEWYDNGENKAVAQGALKQIEEVLSKVAEYKASVRNLSTGETGSEKEARISKAFGIA